MSSQTSKECIKYAFKESTNQWMAVRLKSFQQQKKNEERKESQQTVKCKYRGFM